MKNTSDHLMTNAPPPGWSLKELRVACPAICKTCRPCSTILIPRPFERRVNRDDGLLINSLMPSGLKRLGPYWEKPSWLRMTCFKLSRHSPERAEGCQPRLKEFVALGQQTTVAWVSNTFQTKSKERMRPGCYNRKIKQIRF